VVLNEMTGVMSDPDRVVQRAIYQALYPNTSLNFESGGMPLVGVPSSTSTGKEGRNEKNTQLRWSANGDNDGEK